MSPNNGILFNCVLRPALLNIPFAYRFQINLDFLLPRIAHFDNIIALALLVLETLGFILLYFFYTLNNKMKLFCILDFKLLLTISLCLIISSMSIFLPSSIRLIFSLSLL